MCSRVELDLNFYEEHRDKKPSLELEQFSLRKSVDTKNSIGGRKFLEKTYDANIILGNQKRTLQAPGC